MQLSTLLRLWTVMFMVLAISNASAHGTGKASHGGITVTAHDLNFELVAATNGALLYIDDHGKPLKPNGFTGRITVLNGTAKTEAEWVVAGDRLEARGVRLDPGAKVVAAITSPSKKSMTIRFLMK